MSTNFLGLKTPKMSDGPGTTIPDLAFNMERIDQAIMNLSAGSQEQIFGVYWDKEPSPVLTRTHHAKGLEANVGLGGQWVQNDFDSRPIFGEMHDVTDDLGNVFVRIPKFYIRKTNGPGFNTKNVSKTKHPGFYLPWCFWDFEKGVELPYVDIGKHKGSLSPDNKLESKPGTHPLVNTNIVQMRNYARANNTGGLKGYQQLDIHVYDVLQTLMFIEFATLNTQSIMQGFVSGAYSATHAAVMAESGTNRIVVTTPVAANFRVGQSIGIGTSEASNSVTGGSRVVTQIVELGSGNSAIEFDGATVNVALGNVVASRGWLNGFSRDIAASSGSIGSNSDGKYPGVYRGIESPYGDIWQFVDGVNVSDNQAWVAKDAEQYASNLFASPYEQLGYANNDANGYTREMGFDSAYPFAEFPVAVGGSASAYYSDYYYQLTGQRVAHVGGTWTGGATAGPSYWNLYYASSLTIVLIGGRLLRKPLL